MQQMQEMPEFEMHRSRDMEHKHYPQWKETDHASYTSGTTEELS
jgi:hypothetical protein